MKLQPDNINREDGLKLSKARNLSTTLLRHSNSHRENPKKTHRRACKKEEKTIDNMDTRLSDMVIG
jgi:hypothetical protein